MIISQSALWKYWIAMFRVVQYFCGLNWNNWFYFADIGLAVGTPACNIQRRHVSSVRFGLANGCLHKTVGTYYRSCMYPTNSAWPSFRCATPAGTYRVQSPAGIPKIVCDGTSCTAWLKEVLTSYLPTWFRASIWRPAKWRPSCQDLWRSLRLNCKLFSLFCT